MAKQPNGKSGGRFRLVVLEAELGDGNDFAQMAQAIQHALKPTQAAVPPRVIIQAPAQGLPASQQLLDDTSDDAAQELQDEPVAEPTIRKPKEPRVRRVTVPTAVDLDPSAAASWKEYASKRKAESDAERFLVVAAWSRECLSNEPINQGHVYACYRLAGWSVKIADFGAPLRKLKYDQKLIGDGKEGYTITQIGLAVVDELSIAGD
ncbi:hypothetical protein [Methylobacterium sp. UNC378MF]|uniref:hypothetical protein n=1 Tax=Methylobacterium sp. UNC378MF TaxID=1502748 RepID=UPI00111396B2|nr:hypothetical protein [Methylobacterium sp. UNC378MF]